MRAQLTNVRTSEEDVMTSTSNSNDDLANRYYTQMQNVKVAFAGLRQGGCDSLLEGGEPSSEQSGPKRGGGGQRVRKAHASVRVLRATGLAVADKGGTSDPYAVVESLSCSGKGPIGGSRHCWQEKGTSNPSPRPKLKPKAKPKPDPNTNSNPPQAQEKNTPTNPPPTLLRQKRKTTVKKSTLEPEWDETLELSVFDDDQRDANNAGERRCLMTLSIELWDHDSVRSMMVRRRWRRRMACTPYAHTLVMYM